jgi:hypothetical protein
VNFFRQTKVKTHDMAIIEVTSHTPLIAHTVYAVLLVLLPPLTFSLPLNAISLRVPVLAQYFAEVVKEQQSLEMHGPGAQVRPALPSSAP